MLTPLWQIATFHAGRRMYTRKHSALYTYLLHYLYMQITDAAR